MNCMRCGREIPADQAFCPDCLAESKKYPVKPGIAVQLPKRDDDPFARRPSRRNALTPEVQIARMKRRHRLVTLLLLLTVLLAAGLGILAGAALERHRSGKNLGQNYSTTAPAAGSNDNVSRETSNDRR